jgi:two-component system sensor histidine kinase and response regulator WspE
VTADNLNRLLGLAGESLVASRRLKPFTSALLHLKRQHGHVSRALQDLRTALSAETISPQVQSALALLESRTLDTRVGFEQRLAELDTFDRRVGSLSRRLYDSAVACRMRPFGDGTHAFARMVRDLGRTLGKPVRLEINGSQTPVDREVLEKLDAPLGHLLRNAVDHGIEPPDRRSMTGKAEIGLIRLEARHTAGRLAVLVSDDGGGIDQQKLRGILIARGLATREAAAALSEAELFAFLLLPGFTLASTVTEISGRGVGLDAVQDMLKQLRGTLRISSEPGLGTQFLMQLPLTLSIVRALIADVSGEPYAIPLASIARTVKVSRTQVTLLEGKPCFSLDGTWVGLVDMHQILGAPGSALEGEEWPVILISMEGRTYGLAVDRLKGERELVVRPLDARLGKIRDVNAAALQEDGSPILILDVDDLIRSADKLSTTGAIGQWAAASEPSSPTRYKRVLIVEDSLTVRELERKLLLSAGYEVEVAVDGMDGWNAVRAGDFDLVLTDIDMPRMDGIELVTLIKQDPNLNSIPVMIVSYKDRQEDRDRGLRAGADYYLAKGSFHDQKLLSAVVDQIGESRA